MGVYGNDNYRSLPRSFYINVIGCSGFRSLYLKNGENATKT